MITTYLRVAGVIMNLYFKNLGKIQSEVVVPPEPEVGKNVEIELDLPAVILWNPYVSHSQIFTSQITICEKCQCQLQESYWLDGSSESKQPRILHDMNRLVVLVSAVYSCDNNHRIIAHDERILQIFPSPDFVPFVLLHRTGFTRSLVNLCYNLVSQGLNFQRIETLIIEQRWQAYSRQQDWKILNSALTSPQAQETGIPEERDFFRSCTANAPSDDVLRKIFLGRFLRNEYSYAQEMASIEIGDTISFDHTFKVAVNIGYSREDKVWVPQYDSLFIVMNKFGNIVAWQLTKGTGFEQIEDLLTELCHRAKCQGKSVVTVYIDDCCKLRRKIRHIFGTETSVKLDVFHAIQRTTRTVSKRHKYCQSFVNDLRLVLRERGDSEVKRKSPTPSPEKIKLNLDTFYDKWKDVKDSGGKCLCSPDTSHAIRNLKTHVQLGCLSHIPPGAGTNRNERFHKHVNTYFNRSRIGSLLAYALLTVCMYAHNQTSKKGSRLVCRPISAPQFRKQPRETVVPKFGIVRKADQSDSCDTWEIDVSGCEFDVGIILSIYRVSLFKQYLAKSLGNMKLQNLRNSICTLKPYVVFVEEHYDASEAVDSELALNLNQNSLTHKKVLGDGNCFFTAIAYNLMSNIS